VNPKLTYRTMDYREPEVDRLRRELAAARSDARCWLRFFVGLSLLLIFGVRPLGLERAGRWAPMRGTPKQTTESCVSFALERESVSMAPGCYVRDARDYERAIMKSAEREEAPPEGRAMLLCSREEGAP
jgi:hypothetical protein